MQKIRKGDNVIVLAGRDRGKRGEVLTVMPKENRAVVQGINVVQRHTKPTQFAQGGIVAKELSVDLSNLALLDPKTDEATRVGFKVMEDGSKVRVAKKSGEVIDG
jgi:ribosomal protein L24, bacterial/organelle